MIKPFSCAALLSFAGALAAQPDAEAINRVALRMVDEQSAAVHVVVDERLDLAARLAHATSEEQDRPLVPLPPRIVVGQGGSSRNQTFVRVLNHHGLPEAQFLAFDARLTGGVRVAAGHDAAGRLVIAATPISSRGGGEVRLFNEAGGLRFTLNLDTFRGKPVQLYAGNFLPGQPGDELAIVPESSGHADNLEVVVVSLSGERLKSVAVEIPSQQQLTVSKTAGTVGPADLLWIDAAPVRTVFRVNLVTGDTQTTSLEALDLGRDQRLYPTAYGPNRVVAAGDDAVQSSLLRANPDGSTKALDVGRFENRFWIFPGDWNEGDDGPFVTADGVYGHLRMDLGNPAINTPQLWDQPEVWPKIEAQTLSRWQPLLKPLTQQPLRMWEPTITHRMNWKPALAWAERTDPATGLPRFLALTNANQSSSYGEFGRQNEFHNFTYAYGDTALDQLYAVPLRQFLRRLAVRFREHPERMPSLEPVHEHEISVGVKGSVGDYHPLMIAGFRDYLHRLYGDDAALTQQFGIDPDAFDAPRDQRRGKWDGYDVNNGFYQEWLRFQRYVVNRRIADGFYAAVAAGFPPELVKGHQIPDTFAVGSTETFSDRKARFTPVDYTLTAGVGFGYTRYGVWFKKDTNMLKSASSSGFQSIAMGEYQSLTGDAALAYEQLVHLFENGVMAIHVMHWPASHDKGFNQAMQQAIQKFMSEQRPRPGLAGGVGRVTPVLQGDQRYDIAVIGTGLERTGLLKSLREDGSWQGAVYSVPFRSAMEVRKLRSVTRAGAEGGVRHVLAINDFDVGEQAAVMFRGAAATANDTVRFEVLRNGIPLPGTAVTLPCRADQPMDYRLTLRNQLPAGELELAVDLPQNFTESERLEGWRYTERVARLHQNQFEGLPHRGSLEFAVVPESPRD